MPEDSKMQRKSKRFREHRRSSNEPELPTLYWLIRTGKIKFGSKVGKKFFLDIADAVAKSAAKNMTQAQAPEQQSGEEPRQGAQDRSRKILGAVCVTAAFLCFGWYFWSDYTNHRGSQANEYLKMLKEKSDRSCRDGGQ